MRAVLDPNVLISGLLSPGGAPADVLRAWRAGRYELIVSPSLLAELERVLEYPKIRRRVPADAASRFVHALSRQASLSEDVIADAPRSPDPDDDYLVALAQTRRALLVSGDADLLGLSPAIPVYSPREFLGWLDEHVPRA